jgi:biopolymer transport protein ExbD
MKFQRHLRIIKATPDYAAFACVLFALVMFVMLGPVSYTSGLRIELPASGELPGPDKASVQVAVDAEGRLYFQNEHLTEAQLGERLALIAVNAGEPITLVLQADKSVTNEQILRLGHIARKAGIHDALLATLPRLVDVQK